MDQVEKSKVDIINGSTVNGQPGKGKRLDVMKTYKLYIDGKFPRTESGRYYLLKNNKGEQQVKKEGDRKIENLIKPTIH